MAKQRLAIMSFYNKPYAVLPVRKLGKLLLKLKIIPNYYVDCRADGSLRSITKRDHEDIYEHPRSVRRNPPGHLF